MSISTRQWNIPEESGRHYDWVNGTEPPTKVDHWIPSSGYEEKISYGHPKKDDHYIEGGPFIVSKYSVERPLSDNYVVYRQGYSKPAYKGRFACNGSLPFLGNGLDAPFDTSSGENPAHNFGAEAWAKARARLTKPDFSPLQPIAELRELPRMYKDLVRDLLKNMRRAAGKPVSSLKWGAQMHLANEFGWKPIWNDLGAFLRAHKKDHSKRVKQLIRDEGKAVRREGTIFENSNTITGGFNSGYGTSYIHPNDLVSQCYAGTGWMQNYTDSYEKAWYSGRFRYWLPPGPKDTPAYRRRLARALSSSWEITPSLAYNLIPWTWLIDWYSDFGYFFDATSKGVEDLLIADYFYVMHTKRYTQRRISVVGPWTSHDSSKWERVETTARREYVHKARAVASPFGFGLSKDDLSTSQLGIMAALGLSRI